MPKKKIVGEYFGIEVIDPASDNPRLQLTIGDKWDGKSTVELWCDGRQYDPEMETYRPVYSHSIVTSRWRYDNNDIRGKANEMPNLLAGMRSLLAFLIACAEASENGENADLFPPEVRDWAYHYSDELSVVHAEIERRA